jgi:hypothetical protein
MAMGEYMPVIISYQHCTIHKFYILVFANLFFLFFFLIFHRASALKSKKLLDNMAARGVKYVDCYGVDNALVSAFICKIS